MFEDDEAVRAEDDILLRTSLFRIIVEVESRDSNDVSLEGDDDEIGRSMD